MTTNPNSRRGKLGAVLGLAATLACTIAAPDAGFAAATCAEASVANSAGKAFLSAGKAGTASAFANALRTYTDMNQITLFALGKYRSQVPPDRQPALVAATNSYVASTLADFALKFRGSDILAIECKGGTVISRMEFLGGKPAKRVQWKIAGGKVNDVNIQNVWLAQLLRDNFSTIIQQGGGKIDALYAKLNLQAGTGKQEVGIK